jgi:hypothetical protein
MKKLLFIVFLFCLTAVKAQTPIILNSSDLGYPGDHYDMRIDTAVNSAIVPGNPGANQNWNFLTLSSTLDTTQIDILNSNAGLFHTSFPSANIVYHIDTSANYSYYNSTPIGLLHYGIVSNYLNNGDSIKVAFNNPDTILRLPTTYQDICTSIVKGDSKSHCSNLFYDTTYMGFPMSIPIDTLRIKHNAFHLYEFDAWGTMNTPTNTFPTLRQKNTVQLADSLWGYANVEAFPQYSGWYFLFVYRDTTITYDWWMKDLGIPIVSMEMFNLTNYVSKVTWVRNATLGISNNVDVYNSGVYPNPANNMINITNTAQYNEAIIYDAIGNEVKRQNIQGLNEISVSTANLPNGMYFYNLNGTQGKTSGKFIVKH